MLRVVDDALAINSRPRLLDAAGKMDARGRDWALLGRAWEPRSGLETAGKEPEAFP